MSIRSSSEKTRLKSGNRATYFSAFLMDVHRLIALGYARIRPRKLETTEEEVITERLVKAINDLIEAKCAKKWMRRYHASDNLPVSHPEREGKRRPRVDIEIVLHTGSPRPRFHFESKRLGPDHPVGDYLGDEGLGCFLTAQYARASDEAGMLGYVQFGTCERWATKIESSLLADRRRFRMVKNSGWEAVKVVKELAYSYRTQHQRRGLGRPVSVYHTLLLFCEPSSC